MKEVKRIRIPYLFELKEAGEKISMITAYDHPTALLVDRAGIELVLVGDSVGNNVLGYEETVPVTMDEMIHHTKAVRRGLKRSLLIGDMPFMSFNVSNEKAIENAGRFIKEAGADAVKLEGGEEMADRVEALDRAGIAVMGHVGFTPQRISQLGGHKVQGRTEAVAKKLLADAKLLEEAGAFALILELVPWQIAKLVTESVKIPTIGIGAGPHCDGQVLVLHDVLGLSHHSTKFPKRYTNLNEIIEKALLEFKTDIKSKKYPTIEEHSFSVDEEVLKRLKK
jgi:3-methyl-2-oxobutanoate hydroxymethyltransferase